MCSALNKFQIASIYHVSSPNHCDFPSSLVVMVDASDSKILGPLPLIGIHFCIAVTNLSCMDRTFVGTMMELGGPSKDQAWQTGH